MCGVEVHGGDDKAHDDVRPHRGVACGDKPGPDDADVGQRVVAGGQEGGLRQGAFGLAVAGEEERGAQVHRQRAEADEGQGLGRGGRGVHKLCAKRPEEGQRRDQEEQGQYLAHGSAAGGSPGESEEDQDVDGGIFQEVRTVGEERDRKARR
jgi:hypothetical protein